MAEISGELPWRDQASGLWEAFHMASSEYNRASGRPTGALWKYWLLAIFLNGKWQEQSSKRQTRVRPLALPWGAPVTPPSKPSLDMFLHCYLKILSGTACSIGPWDPPGHLHRTAVRLPACSLTLLAIPRDFQPSLLNRATEAPQCISRDLPWVCHLLDCSRHLPYTNILRNRLLEHATGAPHGIASELRWVCHLLYRFMTFHIDRIPETACSVAPRELPRVLQETSRGSATCSIVLATCRTKRFQGTACTISRLKLQRLLPETQHGTATCWIVLVTCHLYRF